MKNIVFVFMSALILATFAACGPIKSVVSLGKQSDVICGVWVVEKAEKGPIDQSDFEKPDAKKLIAVYNSKENRYDIVDAKNAFLNACFDVNITDNTTLYNLKADYIAADSNVYVKMITIYQKKDGTLYAGLDEDEAFVLPRDNPTITLSNKMLSKKEQIGKVLISIKNK